MITQIVKWKDVDVCFSSEGSGECIVFLHGFMESLFIWNMLSKALSNHFEVICIDLPGHGNTGILSDDHSMEAMADCVYELVKEKKRITLIGHSMGGYVALAFAEKYPTLLAGLGLFHSSALPDSDEKKADRLRTVEVVKQDKLGFISALIPKLFSVENREKMNAPINEMKLMAENTTPEGIVKALLGMRSRPDRQDVLKNAKFPVLFLAGKLDEVIPIGVMLSQAMIPGKSIAGILSKSGHMGFIEEMEESLFLIKKFSEFCFSNSEKQ